MMIEMQHPSCHSCPSYCHSCESRNPTTGSMDARFRGNDNSRRGMTLIEAVLSLALIALILVSLTNVLNVSLKAWRLSGRDDDLIQNARVAMERMTSDIRYAVAISEFSGGALEFSTRYVEDEDDQTEVIRYYKSGSGLYRSVDGEENPPEIAEYVDAFDITLLTSAGQATSDADQAASVEINLGMVNGSDSFSVTSASHLRL